MRPLYERLKDYKRARRSKLRGMKCTLNAKNFVRWLSDLSLVILAPIFQEPIHQKKSGTKRCKIWREILALITTSAKVRKDQDNNKQECK